MVIHSLITGSCLLMAVGANAQSYSATTFPLYAQPEYYAGLNYAQLQSEIESDATDEVFSPNWHTLGINLGIQPSPYLAFEARYGKGVGSGDYKVSTTFGSVKGNTNVRHYFGFYVLPQMPIQNVMSVYGLLGWTKAKAELEVTEFNNMPVYGKVSESEDDFSYGVGVRFRDMRRPDGVAFFAEYAQLIDRSKVDVSGLMLGLSWHF
ncbi:porin family protein [Oceanisphaera sp. IT1-181]|uniref:porin family protein n=1 Tax=Oceanisphaera sp. IT1-181 TaxID=3081199 RepID=UPI0029CA3135|nr:porin family protein [Oceanisphaera sp. IT1-181]